MNKTAELIRNYLKTAGLDNIWVKEPRRYSQPDRNFITKALFGSLHEPTGKDKYKPFPFSDKENIDVSELIPASIGQSKYDIRGKSYYDLINDVAGVDLYGARPDIEEDVGGYIQNSKIKAIADALSKVKYDPKAMRDKLDSEKELQQLTNLFKIMGDRGAGLYAYA